MALKGYVKTYIVLPSTIYGVATGLLVDKQIQNPFSIQMPTLIKASYGRGRAGMVGKGTNIWPNVYINEGMPLEISYELIMAQTLAVGQLYIDILSAIQKSPSTPHGREGFYFGINGEHTLLEVAQEIGKTLVKLGMLTDAEPTTFTQDDLDEYFVSPSEFV